MCRGSTFSVDHSGVDHVVRRSNLSIPSFKWYPANPLSRPRMTHSCQVRGRQMFAVGGRVAWADDERAGCYKMPAVIYDLVDQAENTMFDVSAYA